VHSPRKFRQPVATHGALLRKRHCCGMGTVALSDRLTRPGPLARSEATQRALDARVATVLKVSEGAAFHLMHGEEALLRCAKRWQAGSRSPWSDQIATASSVKAATTRSIVGSSTPSS
jgi:hypothetical protein